MRFHAVLVMSTLALPALVHAQVRASETGSIWQTIDGTKITIQYSRPRARGRSPLFGDKVVRWDENWTPGANYATTLDVSKDVTLEGHRVAKGTYSLWMIVRKSGEWTVVLDPKAKIYHMMPPDSSATQIRFPVRVQDAPFAEVLTFSIPDLRIDGATIAMQWGTTRVAMKLDVEPSLRITLPVADAQPYLGRYDYTTNRGGATTKAFIVSYENGTLKGEWVPKDEYMGKFALIRIAPDWFVPGLYDEKGQIYEVLRPEMTFEFSRMNGRVTGAELRDDNDRIEATATRKP